MADNTKKRLQELADKIRDVWPDKAAELDRLAAEGNADAVNVTVNVAYKLEKFDGDYEPGQTPVETIEGEDNL